MKKAIEKLSLVCLSLVGLLTMAYAEEGLEMKKVSLGKPSQLKFALKPEPRCSFGDLDVISLDMQSGEVKLQLSLEEFGGKGNVFYGKPVEEKDSKYSFLVDLPVIKKPTILGVYLCSVKKDAENTPCGTFPAKDFNELVAPYSVDITRASVKDGKMGAAPLTNPGKHNPSGKIYFFKYVVLDGKGNVEFPEGRMNEEGYEKLLSILNRKSQKGAGEWQLTRLQMLGKKLGSEPLTLQEGGIIGCTLPFYSKEKCVK